MASPDLKCILHKVSASDESDILSFSDDSWKKAEACVKFRKNTKSSVWSKVLSNFPNCKPENGGFHTKCYMSFTSVPKAKLAPYLPLERKPPNPNPADQQEIGAGLRG